MLTAIIHTMLLLSHLVLFADKGNYIIVLRRFGQTERHMRKRNEISKQHFVLVLK